ncbi:MAG: T9SS type A sorting domain-containing protein [Bacteroidales bacterium]|nr:T9SS type A sorting domain-containing protein [Bacteroidales bacterium]
MLRCSVSGEIQMKWYNVTQIGGFAGLNSSDIMDCSTSVAIESTNGMYVGGFVGENDGHIKSCYATGDVTGNTFTGGFAGFSTEGSTLANCYAIGTTTGNDRTGGFIGENSYFATCTNCYSCGKVNSDAWFSGGFAGLNRSTAHTLFCFYDRATSLKNPGIGMDHNGQNMDPVSLPTADFAGEQVFLDAGWGFGNTIVQPWQMGMAPDGFFRPVFYSQQYPVTFQADTGGFVEPDSLLTQFIFLGQNSRSVRAVPSPKHKFLAWYSPAGDSLTNTNPLIVSDIRSDTLVIARFVYYDAIEELPSVKWIVYPNPATASLNIEWDPIIYPGDRCYSLTDIRGREVIKRNSDSNSITLDVSKLDPGVYMLGVLSGKTRLYRKIAIQ